MRVSRRGQAATMVALSLVVLLSTAALAVDLGYARAVKVELQNGADAAAHAATRKLDGTAVGLAAARPAAVSVAYQNVAAGGPIVIDSNDGNDPDGDLVLGVWDGTSFTPSTDPEQVNAAEAHTTVPTLSTFFAPIFGRRSVAVGAHSLMVAERGGAAQVDCYLPLAIPDCLIDYHGGLAGLNDVTLNLNPAGIDGIGWACPNCDPAADLSRNQILNCESMGSATIGDPVGLQNGVATSPMRTLADAVTSSTTSWRSDLWGTEPAPLTHSSIPTSAWGHTFEGPIIVFDGSDGYCTGSGGPYNGTEKITGFMWAAVYDVRTTGGGPTPPTIRMRLDTYDQFDIGTRGGGEDWGITGTSPPHMVSTW